MSYVTFTLRFDRYAIRFRYDPELVELVKTVPSYARSWEPSTREWTVDIAYARALAAAMTELGHTVIGIAAPTTPRQAPSPRYRALGADPVPPRRPHPPRPRLPGPDPHPAPGQSRHRRHSPTA
jgi:hypothetical protein